MNVFISWSGSLSKSVAELLKPFVKSILQATDPFISTEDIDKGSIWFSEIGDQLKDTGLGIICLTRENKDKPWILFESGALSKGLPKNRVITLLINLKPTDLEPPLSQFNATTIDQSNEVRKLIYSINETLGDRKLDKEIVDGLFDTLWPKFDEKVKNALEGYKPERESHGRSTGEILEEVLKLSRSIQRNTEKNTEKLLLALLLPSMKRSPGDKWTHTLRNQLWHSSLSDDPASDAYRLICSSNALESLIRNLVETREPKKKEEAESDTKDEEG